MEKVKIEKKLKFKKRILLCDTIHGKEIRYKETKFKGGKSGFA